jgi:uncharacterized protein (TIGR02118 family)
MVKLVYCVRKREDVSDEEFHRYWLEEHGPRVRGHAEALAADRYVQSHTLDSPLNEGLRASRGSSPAYDGITEMWWSDRAAFEATLATEAGRAAGADLLADEHNFIDTAASSLFLTEEHEIF